MRKNQKSLLHAQDSAFTRKQRLQQRLQELNDKSEQELAALMQSVEKVKATLRPTKPRR